MPPFSANSRSNSGVITTNYLQPGVAHDYYPDWPATIITVSPTAPSDRSRGNEP